MDSTVHSLNDESLIEAFLKARDGGPVPYLKFVESLLDELKAAKWQEAGQSHSLWKRDWAIWRVSHIRNRDDRKPWPIHANLWSLTESVRPMWGDNPPAIDIIPLEPNLDGELEILRNVWKSIELKTRWVDWWESVYDFPPALGISVSKTLWDETAPGGGAPYIGTVDPRAFYSTRWPGSTIAGRESWRRFILSRPEN